MKRAICLLIIISCFYACKEEEETCTGYVVREIVHTAAHEQLSATYTLYCDGNCADGSRCDKEEVYNTPQPGGLIKKQWCGCEAKPDKCTIVLKTYSINGRTIQQADCTAWNTCPEGDSCIQLPNRSKVETQYNGDGSVRTISYSDTLTCGCVDRQ